MIDSSTSLTYHYSSTEYITDLNNKLTTNDYISSNVIDISNNIIDSTVMIDNQLTTNNDMISSLSSNVDNLLTESISTASSNKNEINSAYFTSTILSFDTSFNLLDSTTSINDLIYISSSSYSTDTETSTIEQITTLQSTSIQQTNIPTCMDTSTSAGSVIKNTNCQTTSPYQPSFLNKNNMLYFDYPIQQLITCSSGRTVLKCPTNLYLNIYSAYYGIQQNTPTSCSQSSLITNLTYPSICYRSDTYDLIYSLCQNKSNCYLYADKSYFGDPCPGFDIEQLFVQYQCTDLATLSQINNCPKITTINSVCPTLTSSSQIQRSWCDLSRISIICTTGRYINILCALYGIDPNIRTCGFYYTGAPTSCNSYDTLINIKSLCNYKNRCSFNFTSINNICPDDYSPILIVQYECLTSAQLITTTVSSISYTQQESTIVTTSIQQKNMCYCSADSVYMPKSLTSNRYYSFDFPIYEQTVCYASRLNIICHPNSYIHIYSAYFGIQFQTYSDCMLQNNDTEIPKLCYSPLSYDKIVSKCEYKNSCDLTATFTDLNFIEICPDYRNKNQLLIQYQCIDDYLFNLTINQCVLNKVIPSICSNQVDVYVNQGTWCDNGLGNGSIMNIQCSTNQLIEIVCAFYGKDPNISTCSQQIAQSSICYFNSTITIVNNNCNGKNSCKISNFKSTFSDPCDGGLDKTLFIQWKCIS